MRSFSSFAFFLAMCLFFLLQGCEKSSNQQHSEKDNDSSTHLPFQLISADNKTATLVGLSGNYTVNLVNNRIQQKNSSLILSYQESLESSLEEKAQKIEQIYQKIRNNSACRRSDSSAIDVVLGEGCLNFQKIYYRANWLPTNLDGLATIADYTNYLRKEDVYSYYFQPRSYANNQATLSGQQATMGVHLKMKDTKARISTENPLTIARVLPYTRAWWDGLQKNDVILAVKGLRLDNLTYKDAIEKFPKKESEITELLILRDNRSRLIQTAAEFHIARKIGDTKQIAYLNLRQFTTTSGKEIEKDFNQLNADGSIQKLILDLRGNGGGSLSGALKLVDYLINRDTPKKKNLIITIKGKSSKVAYYLGDYAKNNIKEWGKSNFVLLIDKNSASATEITAATLQDYGLASLIGIKTHGKGVGQTVTSLLDGSGLYITSFEILSSKNQSWHTVGVSPDYSFTAEAPNFPDNDTMLAAAITYLQTGKLPQATTSTTSRVTSPSSDTFIPPSLYWKNFSHEPLY